MELNLRFCLQGSIGKTVVTLGKHCFGDTQHGNELFRIITLDDTLLSFAGVQEELALDWINDTACQVLVLHWGCSLDYLLIVSDHKRRVKDLTVDNIISVYWQSVGLQVDLSTLDTLDHKTLVSTDLCEMYGKTGQINNLFPLFWEKDHLLSRSSPKENCILSIPRMWMSEIIDFIGYF